MTHQQQENTSQLSAAYSMVNQNDEVDSPPTYEAASCSQNPLPDEHCLNGVNDKKVEDKLPSYELATDLPSYQDVQQSKEEEARDEVIDLFFGINSFKIYMDILADSLNEINKLTPNTEDLLPSRQHDDELYVDGVAIGSDCAFICAFILAFFFNWLGFFIGYCIMMNLASRYGAITGFGLSMVNWLLYVKYHPEAQKYLMTTDRHVMWWFFLVFAALLSLKGLINWFKARRLTQLTPEQRQNERNYWENYNISVTFLKEKLHCKSPVC